MVTFLDFEKVAPEKTVAILKQRQVLVKARRKIHKEKIKCEEKKRGSKVIRRINFE